MGKNIKKPETERARTKIPEVVEKFAQYDLKKYKKKNADAFASKKDVKRGFVEWRLARLPHVIAFLVRYGYLPENQGIKDRLYDIIANDMIKPINKSLDDGMDIDNLEAFPIIAYDMIRVAERYHQEELKEDPNAEKYDMTDVIDLVKRINKKKLKKMTKKGVDEKLAFDLLCVIPNPEMVRRNTMFRVKQVFQIIYEHAKTLENIDINPIFSTLFTDKQEPIVISFSLLERKEKYVNFTDWQKDVFNKITFWTFDKIEQMDKEDIMFILKGYFDVRKRDKAQNKDSARRYFIGTLPEDKYPRILSVVNKMKTMDNTIEEFL